MSSNDLVLVERKEHIAIVTLNRPEALNALTHAMGLRIVDVFTQLAEDDDTEVVIFTGAGRAFSVGLDLKELGGEIHSAASVLDLDIDGQLANFPKPLIGAVNGYAITGGFELALLCDFIIASPAARFADTHARVGVVPLWGLSQRLPRLIGVNRALELSLTGNYLDAQTAERWGLVNRVVSQEELIPHCEQLAGEIVSTDRATRNEMRRVIREGWLTNLGEGLEIEKVAHDLHMEREVSPEKVAERRAAIQERGRTQKDT